MASALHGMGVIETFARLAELTYDLIDRRYGLKNDHGLERDAFVGKLTACAER